MERMVMTFNRDPLLLRFHPIGIRGIVASKPVFSFLGIDAERIYYSGKSESSRLRPLTIGSHEGRVLSILPNTPLPANPPVASWSGRSDWGKNPQLRSALMKICLVTSCSKQLSYLRKYRYSVDIYILLIHNDKRLSLIIFEEFLIDLRHDVNTSSCHPSSIRYYTGLESLEATLLRTQCPYAVDGE